MGVGVRAAGLPAEAPLSPSRREGGSPRTGSRPHQRRRPCAFRCDGGSPRTGSRPLPHPRQHTFRCFGVSADRKPPTPASTPAHLSVLWRVSADRKPPTRTPCACSRDFAARAREPGPAGVASAATPRRAWWTVNRPPPRPAARSYPAARLPRERPNTSWVQLCSAQVPFYIHAGAQVPRRRVTGWERAGFRRVLRRGVTAWE